MQADYSVELGRDDPALELPWSSADPAICYLDLKSYPELIHRIPEAVSYPALREFLVRINAPDFHMLTAKCDARHSRDILPEEEIFGAEYKFVSYIDLVFTSHEAQTSFEKYEDLADDICQLLKRVPELPAAVDLVIRRCYYHNAEQTPALTKKIEIDAESEVSQCGFCVTAYAFGFGANPDEAAKLW